MSDCRICPRASFTFVAFLIGAVVFSPDKLPADRPAEAPGQASQVSGSIPGLPESGSEPQESGDSVEAPYEAEGTDQADSKTGNEDLKVQFLVPKRISLKFGEPLYVPMAIRNPTDQPVLVPCFEYHWPRLIYTVRAGDARARGGYGGHITGGGEVRLLPAHSVETTVMLVNIWSPAVALEIKQTGSATIDFWTDLFVEEPDATTALRISGSALTQAGEQQLLKLAASLAALKDGKEWVSNGAPNSTVFDNGVSPLSWFDPKTRHVGEWWDVDSEFYRDATSLVAADNRLSRMIRFSELIFDLRGCDAKQKKPGLALLDDYFDLLSQCDPDERHFRLVALKAIDRSGFPTPVRDSDLSLREIFAEVRQRLPTYSMYFEYRDDCFQYSIINELNPERNR